MLKKIFYLITPPALSGIYRKVRQRLEPPLGSTPCFDKEGLELFRKYVAGAEKYAEYGCGGSSKFVLDHSQAKVVSVDSSAEWVSRVRQIAGTQVSRLDITAVDLGPIGPWGTPLGYSRRQNFPIYVELPLSKCPQPDVILIDGRFRVACFLHSLLSTAPGTTILFDDYTIRPEYHVVEEVCLASETTSQMARFVTPESFDREKARRLKEQFLIVWH